MDLNTLTANLKAQASANSTIVLDGTVLSAKGLDGIRMAFSLAADANLTITGVGVADIPAPVGGTLTISAGRASVLNQTGVGMSLTFTAPGGTLQAVITARMGAAWKFGDSFKGLEIFPFQDLAVSDAYFVYTTAEQAAFAWPGEPDYTIALAPGLNFLSDVTLGNFSLIGSLLGAMIGTAPFKFYGPFSPTDGEQLPVGTIRAPLGEHTFAIGVAPNALTLASPAVAVQIGTSDAYAPIQSVDLQVEAVFNDTLQVAIGIPMSGSTLSVSTTPLPNHGSIDSLIEALPGGTGFASYIPGELSKIFAKVGLDNFTMVISAEPKVSYLSLSISTLESWPVIPNNILILDKLNLRVEVVDPTGLNWTQIFIEAKAKFLPKIFGNNDFDFTVSLQKQTSWEVSTVSGAYYGAVNLGDIVDNLLGNKTSVPPALHAVSFSNFGVNATRSTPNSPFNYSFYGSAEVAFPILDRDLTAQLNLAVDNAQTGYTILLSGAVVIGNEAFTLSLDLGTTGSKLTAKWKNTGAPLGFGDIASAFGWDAMPALPENLDLGLIDAEFTYDLTGGTVAFSAHSVHYGQVLFASFTPTIGANANKRVYLFALDVPLKLQLSMLPLVGALLPADAKLGVEDLQIIVASAALGTTDIASLNDLITQTLGDKALIPSELREGLTFAAEFQIGSGQLAFTLPLTGSESGSAQPPASAPAASEQTLPAVSPSTPATAGASPGYQAGGKWFTIGKNFGPVSFQRFGVQYQDGKLFFLLDASLGFSGLALGMDGLGIGSPLTKFKPVPHLDGISIAFSSGPVKIDGSFLVVPPPLPPGVTEEFIGEVVIAVPPYLIAGVGSYAKVNGNPSVFLFAEIKGDFGGPPAFFITGFMGGFGYNSQLTLPAADQVYRFPFVAGLDDPTIFGSTTPSPLAVMNALSGAGGKTAWVTPVTGETWIAAGVMFRSFELVLGRVLLVVKFGKDFEVALLGLANLSLPQGETTNVYAYVELQLEAVFKPNEGTFSIIASLTPNSYLLTKACHLTGGFAFCLWFGNNLHAGDFVVTVGGYHPAFLVPSWYPQVSRVGLNWAVGGGVTIKGGVYFALTPSAAMAGGSLEALYQSGDLRAWFTAYANMMIRWKPFHFTVSIGMSIGASYRLNLAFSTVTHSVELGASLLLWGPPTGGIVHVDWSIISFSISFGADPVEPDSMTLDWPGFQSLLPNKPPASQANLAATAASSTPVVLSVNINRGLTREQSDGSWLVRADELVFTTDSAVPSSGLQLSGKDVQLPAGAPTTINIRPMKQQGVTSVHQVSLMNLDENKEIDLSIWPSPVTQTRNLPEALWGSPIDDKATPAPAAATIPNLPTGIQLAPPPATEGPAVGPIDPANLIDPLGGGYMPLCPGTQLDPIPAPVVDELSIVEMMTTLASPTAVQAQQALVVALTELSAAPPTSSPLTQLAQQADSLFSQAPLRAT